jgi:hypothetical protein
MPMHGKEFGQKDHLLSSMLASKYVLLISLMQIQMNKGINLFTYSLGGVSTTPRKMQLQ